MGPSRKHLQHKHRSRPDSLASDDELHETGVHVSPVGASPQFSVVQTQSQSGSSSRGEPFHLIYPGESQETEVYPYDSASRTDSRPQASRSTSSRREREKRTRRAQVAPRPRARPPPEESSSEESEESSDSAEDYPGARPEYGARMPRPHSYYGPNGSYGYPSVPPSGQVVPFAAPPPQHPPYQQHPQPHHPYPPMASPPPGGFPPHQGYPQDPRARHDPGNPHYRPPPYGPGAMAPYGGAPGYFPPYGQYPHPYGPGGPNPYLPSFMHDWQVASHSRKTSPPAEKKDEEKAVVVAPPPPPPPPQGPNSEEFIKRMQDMLIAASSERDAKEADRQLKIASAEDRVAQIRKAEQERAIEDARIRAEAVRMAKEQAEAAARAQAERAAHEQKIREETARAIEKAMAEKAAAAAEQTAREARIREEAARAALEKAAADAKAKAEQQAREAKIASDAAADAKNAAEKAAAEEAAKKEEAAKAAKEEAEKKMKEAEDAAAKAKTEAEVATAAAAAAKPPDKKPPVRFKDAIGRNYNFPWERCCKWRDMENLIVQAFQHIEDLGDHVINGRYDLIGPDKEIIMPQYWDYIIQPDMHITMMLWPLPEKKPPPMDDFGLGLPDPLAPPIPPAHNVINLDELIPKGGKKDKKGKKPIGNSFSNWMLGGAPSRSRKSVKAYKKPDITTI